MADKKRYRKEIALTGKFVRGNDAAKIGENFQELTNIRYDKDRLRGVVGMTKINTTAISTYTTVKSGIHYRKSQPSESHLLVDARDSSDNVRILDNTAVVPAQGNFSATALYSPTASSDNGRFSLAPNGDVVYCNGSETLIWGGNEREIAGLINYDPNGSFSYDFSENVRNTDTDDKAVLTTSSGGIDANTMLLLHLDNNVTDSSPTTAHTVTNNNVTFTTTNAIFGTHRAIFHTDASLTIPDNADFDFSGGTFTIDCWINFSSLGAVNPIYHDNTVAAGAQNAFDIFVDTSGAVNVSVLDGGVEQFGGTFKTANDTISINTDYHIEVVENGDDWYIFVDGVLKAYTSDTVRCENYDDIVQIGYNEAVYLEAKVDEFRVSNVARHTSDFEYPSTAYSTNSDEAYIYVGSVRPLAGFKFYIGTSNTSTSTMVVSYWSGSAWVACSSLSDGTVAAGKSLATTGSVTFTTTVSTAKLKYINEDFLYWYRVYVNDVSANTSIYYATVNAPFQDLTDLWNGEPAQVDFAQKRDSKYFDITLKVRENEYTSSDTATFASFDDLDAGSSYLLFGFYERMSGLSFKFVSGKENETDGTVAAVAYWNGAGWTSVGVLSDGTLKNGKSFGSSGTITWNQITKSSEFTTNINNDYELFYYKVSFSKSLSSDVQAYYITGIRAQQEISAFKYPFYANDRLWLCADMKGKKNMALYSASGSSQVLNGDDSNIFYFGDDTELVGSAWLYSQFGSSIYNIMMFFKQNEIWAVVGNDPEGWVKYRLSSTIGCHDPETIKVVNVGGTGNDKAARSIVIWRADDGIYLSDGRSPVLISEDISYVFDRNNSTYAINNAVDCSAFWDATLREYHFLWASGSSIDEEYVFSFERPGWFEFGRGAGNYLQYGLEVRSTTGTGYNYGFISAYAMRLEYGYDFNGTDITHTLQFGDISLAEGQVSVETKAEYHGLIAVAKTNTSNTLTITHYGDGDSTGTSWTTSADKSGYRIIEPVYHEHTDSHLFHSWKITMITDDETVGFEPLYFYVLYSVTTDHIRDRRT